MPIDRQRWVPQADVPNVNSRLRRTVEVLDIADRADVVTITASATVPLTYPQTLVVVDTSGGTVTATLPTAFTVPGFVARVRRTGTNTATVTDGVTSWTIPRTGEGLTLVCTGLAWVPVSEYAPGRLFPYAIQTKNTNATLVLTSTQTQVDVDTSGGNVTITLPPAATVTGYTVDVTKSETANTLTVDADGSETINGVATVVWATRWVSYTFLSRGDTWRII